MAVVHRLNAGPYQYLFKPIFNKILSCGRGDRKQRSETGTTVSTTVHDMQSSLQYPAAGVSSEIRFGRHNSEHDISSGSSVPCNV
jgi:hypothetical protein